MFYPDIKEFKNLSKKYNIIPVYKEILADCETPVSAYSKLALNKEYSYLLESVEGSERWGRYSFLSWAPKLIFKSKGKTFTITKNSKTQHGTADNPLNELKKIMSVYKPVHIKGLPRFWGGAVGYIGYEMIHNFEEIPPIAGKTSDQDDAALLLTDTIVIFDHFTHKTKIVACADMSLGKQNIEKHYKDACKKINSIIEELRQKKNLEISNFLDLNKPKAGFSGMKSNLTKHQYMDSVCKAKEYIKAGDIIQTVLSQRFEKKMKAHPFSIYRVLRTLNPSPYMLYLNFNDFQLVGSSPEILVRKEENRAILRPIAGTKPRGKTSEEDIKNEKE